jgi:hypothetical protein
MKIKLSHACFHLSELLSDILKDKPGEAAGMESVVIIDGLPVVPAEQKERQEKLKSVVRKLIIQHSKCQQSDFLEEIYPVDETGSTKGFVEVLEFTCLCQVVDWLIKLDQLLHRLLHRMLGLIAWLMMSVFFRFAFFEFTDPETVKILIRTMNGYKFDKQHTLAVDLFIDFEKYVNYPDEWEEPTVRPFKEIVSFSCFFLLSQFYVWFVFKGEFAVLARNGRRLRSVSADFRATDGLRRGGCLRQHTGRTDLNKASRCKLGFRTQKKISKLIEIENFVRINKDYFLNFFPKKSRKISKESHIN